MSKETLTLNFDLDPVERLRQEVDFTDSNYKKIVGEFLINEFQKDENLRLNYFNKKITLDIVWDAIRDLAKSKATNGCSVLDNDEVFGFAVHFIEDGKIKENKNDSVVLSKEDKESLIEQAKSEFLKEQIDKLKRAEKKKLEKNQKEQEESGQLSLFDF